MRRNRLWTGLASLTSLLLTFTVVGTNCMYSYAGTVNGALGIKTSKVVNEDDEASDTEYFKSEYGALNADNLQKLINDTYDESVLEEEEGAVLLKNDDNALPLNENERNVTLFGHAFRQPLYKAASAGSNGYKGEYCIDPYEAFENEGFNVNGKLKEAYKASKTERGTGAFDFITQTSSVLSMGEEKSTFYTSDIQSSWADGYNDAAIVMFAREGGEGVELATKDTEGKSQLALHEDEKNLLRMIKDSGKFKKIIVLLNTGNPMELDWLDEYGVDACLWIGEPGQRGFEGVVKLLTGEANPSGHLTDTYAANSLSSPAVVNASGNNQKWTNIEDVLKKTTEGENDISYYDSQAEGIYVGYKYYETRYEDTVLKQGNADSTKGSSTGKEWNYADEVTYPFGYGLSYTQFEQKIENVEVGADEIDVKVNVKNTGEKAGKSVVQIYAQTPYGDYEKSNNVEKASIQLLNFTKTGKLEPGQSETVEIVCDKYLLASYDYTKAKGYIMSEGEYYLTLGDDVHKALNNILAAKDAEGLINADGTEAVGNAENTYKWNEDLDTQKYSVSRYSGNTVTNLFEDADLNYWIKNAVTYISRSDWDRTYPSEATKVAATDEMISEMNGEYYEKPNDAPSLSEVALGKNKGISLASLIGLDYDDEKWGEYLDQFTLTELASLTADNFGTGEITSVGKPAVVVGDGPDGVGGTFDKEKYGDGRDDTCFPCQLILASTYNKDLMKRRGELMGEECLYLDMECDWMPGGNLHRTPFGGRNFEYFSEDANMTYLCTIPEVEGMESKGVHAGIKHFAGNDQENNRQGIACFFNEQAFREGDLRCFEGAIAVAKSQSVMQGFNRIGLKWCSASKALITDLLRGEWGFIGQVETDAVASGEPYKVHFVSTLAAGVNSYCIDFGGASSQTIEKAIKANDDGNLANILKESAHHYLYPVVNSAIMNGYSVNSKVVAVTPWWQPLMTAVIILLSLIDILFIFLIFKGRKAVENILVEEANA